MVLAAASGYATLTTAGAAVCSLKRLVAEPEMPLRLAMSTAALLVALPQLILVTFTLFWNAYYLLGPVISTQPCIRRVLAKKTASERMSAVTGDALLVVACLAGLIVMMWSLNSAYDRNLPVSVVELTLFCGVMLTMCCMVVFWTIDLSFSIEAAFAETDNDHEPVDLD
jgi:hypothetical protein